MNQPTTIQAIGAKKAAGEKLVMATSYDAAFTHMFNKAGVDLILIGDSLGMVIQGQDSTLSVTVDEIIYHSRCVGRANTTCHLVADMPFMSWQPSLRDALHNAGRLVAEGGAQSVKLEGGAAAANTIEAITTADIPVMGHVGLTPQSIHAMGGFKVQGKSDEAAQQLLSDAKTVESAGAYAMVLEGIPTDLAKQISASVAIPTIGIGAGPHCDGQVLVGYDMLGLTPNFKPKFVKQYANFYNDGVTATKQYCAEVRDGSFPTPDHSFTGK